MKRNTLLITGIVLATALLTAGESFADGFRFGLGVTRHGTSLSIGYREGSCTPPPHCGRTRHAPAPHPATVMHCRPSGHYETRVERFYVDGYWTQTVCHRGRITRVWHPGYWTERTVRVWVNH